MTNQALDIPDFVKITTPPLIKKIVKLGRKKKTEQEKQEVKEVVVVKPLLNKISFEFQS